MIRLILASGSANRRQALKSLNIPFEIIPANIDEKAVTEKNPKMRAKKLAREKGEAVFNKHYGVIISADTFTTYGALTLEKPHNSSEAKKMLNYISGKETINNTGVFYFDPEKKISFSRTIITQVKFRQFSNWEIENYLRVFPVTTWAAAYAASELYVMGMIQYVKGSLTGLTHGLPLEHLVPLLIKSGFNPHP